MQPASGLFIVAVASKTSHDAQVSPLIGFTEDLFTALSASADAVKDPDRRVVRGTSNRPPSVNRSSHTGRISVAPAVYKHRVKMPIRRRWASGTPNLDVLGDREILLGSFGKFRIGFKGQNRTPR
jgi:hypothetical protein